MASSRWVVLALLGYLIGVAIRSWSEYEMTEYFLLFGLAGMLSIMICWRSLALLPILFFLGIAVAGVFRTEKVIAGKTENIWADRIRLEAVVTRDPEWRGDYQSVILKTKDGIILETSVGMDSPLAYGEKVDVDCTPALEKDRNSQLSLAARGISFRCTGTKIIPLRNFQGSRAWRLMVEGKHTLERTLTWNVPEPEASLGLGFIFGGSARMSREMKNDFSRTGLTHIIAVSGYNVALVAEWIMAVLLAVGFWRRQALIISILGVGIFVVLVGLPASAVRAGVMISLVLWALAQGRLAGSHRALLLAGSLMCVFNPLLLRYDLGFQLSVLATLGIIEYQGIKSFAENLPGKAWIDAAGTTMMAQIFVLPLLIYNFHSASLIFLVANMAVALLIPTAMLLSLAVACLGAISQLLGVVSGWVAYIPLTLITRTVEFMANFSWSSIPVPEINSFWIVLWYAVLGSGLMLIHSDWRFQANAVESNL